MKFVYGSNVELVDAMGSDQSIISAAVVSTGADVCGWPEERRSGLVNRLMKDRHGAPFEHVTFTFMVQTPLFTARQMMRHRIASFNEVSGRYRVLEETFYLVPEARPVRQVGKTMDYEMVQDRDLQLRFNNGVMEHCIEATARYRHFLELGVSKELARVVLPTNIMTEFFVTINLRSLFNFLSLRGTEKGLFPSHPQFEIAQVADEMEGYVEDIAPNAHAAFKANGRVQP